jgi:hypothetical protein
MLRYLLLFVAGFWGHSFRFTDVRAAALDVLSTDASAIEALMLMGIPPLESGFRPDAVGKLGERGPWQVRPPAESYGAKEALRRLRLLGIAGYVGCGRARTDRCDRLAAERVAPAIVYFAAFPPPNKVDSPPWRLAQGTD